MEGQHHLQQDDALLDQQQQQAQAAGDSEEDSNREEGRQDAQPAAVGGAEVAAAAPSSQGGPTPAVAAVAVEEDPDALVSPGQGSAVGHNPRVIYRTDPKHRLTRRYSSQPHGKDSEEDRPASPPGSKRTGWNPGMY
jgi:hypothetical protein